MRTFDDIANDPQAGDCFQVQNGHRFTVVEADADSVIATEHRPNGVEISRDIPRGNDATLGTWVWTVRFFESHGGTIC